jgi:hypothetical protein
MERWVWGERLNKAFHFKYIYSKLIGFTKNIKKSPFLQMEKGVWGMRSKKAFHF